jgi:hypothetical protein
LEGQNGSALKTDKRSGERKAKKKGGIDRTGKIQEIRGEDRFYTGRIFYLEKKALTQKILRKKEAPRRRTAGVGVGLPKPANTKEKAALRHFSNPHCAFLSGGTASLP